MTKQVPVTKAIIAAAGFGSRFLPQTKAIPKEMFPLVNKPVIQYIVEELVEAGITDIIIVTSDSKPAIEAHFRAVAEDLKQNLLTGNKHELLSTAEAVAQLANFTFVTQSGPYGNATPIMNAAHLLNGEPFMYAFADDFFQAEPNRFVQMISAYNQYGGSVLACARRDGDADYARYGYAGGEMIASGIMAMDRIVEKPKTRAQSPSNLASVSSYLFDPTLLTYLEKQLAAYDGSKEFQMQDAMQLMMQDGHKFYGREITGGAWYDTGTPIEYMKTVFEFALKHPDIGADFRAFVLRRSKQLAPKPSLRRNFTGSTFVRTDYSQQSRSVSRVHN